MDADSWRGFHDKFKELAGEERTLLEKLEKREILPGSPEERILQVSPEDRWLRAYGDYSTDILGGVCEAIRRLPPNERRKAWARERGWSIQGRVMTAKLLGKYPGDKWVERLAQPAKPECGRWHLCGGSSEGIRAQFVALATQAGKALDPPQGTAPLDFWLHSLFLYLRKSSSHELQGHVCEPSATFCSHLEAEALKLERAQVREEAPAARPVAKDRKKRPVIEPLDAETFHGYLRTMKEEHPKWTVRKMCVEVDRLPANAKTPPRKSWQVKSRSAAWAGNYDHPKTKSSVKNFYSTVLRGNNPA